MPRLIFDRDILSKFQVILYTGRLIIGETY